MVVVERGALLKRSGILLRHPNGVPAFQVNGAVVFFHQLYPMQVDDKRTVTGKELAWQVVLKGCQRLGAAQRTILAYDVKQAAALVGFDVNNFARVLEYSSFDRPDRNFIKLRVGFFSHSDKISG